MSKASYPSEFIHTKGTIIERFAETAFRASLPNGKTVIAFLEQKNAHLQDEITANDIVALTICPSNMDRARIDEKLVPKVS